MGAGLLLGACAERHPSVEPPPVPPATPPPASDAPAARINDAGATEAYTRDVWVVTTTPSAVFLLAKFEETPGDGCEERLLAHARTLGANRLYIDRTLACGGSAYFVRAASVSTDSTAPLRGNVHVGDNALLDWVRARWKRPASISEAASKRLCVVVQFTVSPMRRVLEVRGQPIRPSGNPEFDESVRAAIESAIPEHANVPMPPRDLVGDVVSYRVEFTEGDPRSCRQPVP